MTNCNITWYIAFTTYMGYMVLMAFGYFREVLRKLFPDTRMLSITPPGYAPLLRDFDDFYYRRMFCRVQDCWGRPICSAPSAHMDVVKRVSHDHNKTMHLTQEKIRCLNLGSYNYLGFSSPPEHVTKSVINDLHNYGISTCSSHLQNGYTPVHRDLEAAVAKHLGKEDAIVIAMGYATNSTVIPALVDKQTLIISDSLNHTSIVTGARDSGATIRVFKHGNMKSLEKIIKNSIIEGVPNKDTPWSKIIILVEGIYSMEGEIIDLPKVVEIKKKYKCYLYVDEAHSIGALGKNGRGVCEHTGVDPSDVDILMGTFTKSFGSVGGYVCGSKDLINYLRYYSYSNLYGSSIPVPCAQQILSTLRVISGDDGSNIGRQKLDSLHENANFFRTELIKLGFEVIGDKDSPVIVVMVYNPGKVIAFSRECLRRGVAVVVVGAPATALLEARIRFCVSAAHTKEQLKEALKVIDEIGELTMVKYKTNIFRKLATALF